MSVVRGRPPAFAGGMWGTSSAHCGSVRSEGYRLRRMLASMPLLSGAILPAPIPTRHFAHGFSVCLRRLPQGARGKWHRSLDEQKGELPGQRPDGELLRRSQAELVHRTRFRTRREAKAVLFEYIEVFYNRQRRHSSVRYRTPAQARVDMTMANAA